MTSAAIYAGFWRRALANIIDMIILMIISAVLFSLIQTTIIVQDFISQIIMAIYTIFFIASHYQATPGKKLLKIKINSADAKKLSLQASTIRFLVLIIPTIPMFLFMLTPQYSNGIEALELSNQNRIKEFNFGISLSAILAIIWSLIWFLPIAFTKEKTGIHDIICKTRAYRT